MLLQMSSQQMQVFTRGYLVFELTGSATLLGVVTGAMSIPIVALGLFGGGGGGSSRTAWTSAG